MVLKISSVPYLFITYAIQKMHPMMHVEELTAVLGALPINNPCKRKYVIVIRVRITMVLFRDVITNENLRLAMNSNNVVNAKTQKTRALWSCPITEGNVK
jgi:hypothetical protein